MIRTVYTPEQIKLRNATIMTRPDPSGPQVPMKVEQLYTTDGKYDTFYCTQNHVSYWRNAPDYDGDPNEREFIYSNHGYDYLHICEGDQVRECKKLNELLHD